MAFHVYDNINVHGGELQNALAHNLGSAPTPIGEGHFYYDTATHHLYYYNGTTFVPSDSSAAVQSVGGGGIISSTGGLNPVISLNAASITDAYIASGAAIALSKLATDPLARANHTGTQLAATISDFNTAVRLNRLDQMAAPTADVSMSSHKLTNVTDPTNPQDAATKAYVDAAGSGVNWKTPVRAATTGNVTLSGTQTIDGITLTGGDRLLVKDQSTATENGIYVVASGAWSRSGDADSSAELAPGSAVFVSEGLVNGDGGFVLTTDAPVTLGSSNLTFVQFTALGQVTAGAGLTKTGSTIDVGAGTGIQVNANDIQIHPTWAGQTSITTLGTIATGTWQATAVAVLYGGTGATTASGARTNLAAVGKYTSSAIGDNSTTAFVINHALNTQNVTVAIRRVASPYDIVYSTVECTDVNNVTVRFKVAPTTGQFVVTVEG